VIEMSLLLTVDPAAIDRARRLAYAMRMIRTGTPRADVSRSLVERFRVSRKTAYRIVSMAIDIAGERT